MLNGEKTAATMRFCDMLNRERTKGRPSYSSVINQYLQYPLRIVQECCLAIVSTLEYITQLVQRAKNTFRTKLVYIFVIFVHLKEENIYYILHHLYNEYTKRVLRHFSIELNILYVNSRSDTKESLKYTFSSLKQEIYTYTNS